MSRQFKGYSPYVSDPTEVVSITPVKSSTTYGRIGIALLLLPAIQPAHTSENHELPRSLTVFKAIVAALSADSRVSEVRAPDLGKGDFMQLHFGSADSVRTPQDSEPSMPNQHVHVESFMRPIVFALHIPTRLQRQDRGAPGIPAETYWAAWDGVELLVSWESADPKKAFGHFGGFAALDVLSDAVESAGYHLAAQPCGPTCNYPFAHQKVEFVSSTANTEVVLSDVDRWTTRVSSPKAKDHLTLMGNLCSEFAYVSRVFARMRSHGRALRSVEGVARRDLGQLLRLQYERAALAAENPFVSVPHRFSKRTLGSEISKLIASLWLRLAALDENRRQWDQYRYLYESNAHAEGVGLLFRSEFPDEVNTVESLDESSLRSTLVQMSSRADSRYLAWATAGGALAGAAIGAGLLTLLNSAISAGTHH